MGREEVTIQPLSLQVRASLSTLATDMTSVINKLNELVVAVNKLMGVPIQVPAPTPAPVPAPAPTTSTTSSNDLTWGA
jgi:hypothetical protein